MQGDDGNVNDSAQVSDIDRLAKLQAIDRRLKERRDRMTALAGEADSYELELQRKRQAVVTLTAERDSLAMRLAIAHAFTRPAAGRSP